MNISSRSAVLIYNPAAGQLRKGSERVVRRAVEGLERRGWRVDTRPTPGPNQAASLASEAARSGAAMVVALGGDGTINEVASGLIHTETPLLALPGGTANVLANEIGFTSNLGRALDRFERCTARTIAMGRVSNASGDVRHFLLMAGVGLDARIVAQVNPETKKLLGKVAYWIGGFSAFGQTLAEFDVDVGGRTVRASFALATRVRNYGGDLEIARRVRLLDPDFEVVLFEGANSFRYVKYLAGVAANSLYGMSGVTIVRAREVRFRPVNGKPVDVQTDGESFGVAPGAIEIVPDALRLLVPQEYGV